MAKDRIREANLSQYAELLLLDKNYRLSVIGDTSKFFHLLVPLRIEIYFGLEQYATQCNPRGVGSLL